jgi:hypothetical protein
MKRKRTHPIHKGGLIGKPPKVIGSIRSYDKNGCIDHIEYIYAPKTILKHQISTQTPKQ